MLVITAISAICTYYTKIPSTTDHMLKIVTLLNILVALLLGIYLSKKISRWWQVREECLGTLWGSITNLCQLLAVYLGQDDEHYKYRVLRYGLLSHALVYKQAQITTHVLQDLLTMGLLTPDELLSLKQIPHKAQVVWIWQTQLLNHLIWEEEKLPKALIKNVTDQLLAGRDSIRRLFSFVETQVPFPYTHMLALTVHTFHIILSMVCGINICVALSSEPVKLAKLVLYIFLVVVFCLLYQGILDISVKLENPLGNDDIDFPRMAYHLTIKETGEAFFRAGMTKPFANMERS